MATAHQELIQGLSAAVDGSQEAHVWRSGNHPGTLMRTLFKPVGDQLGSTDSGMGYEINTLYQVYYDGTMPQDEARVRLNDTLHAGDN